ncbi:MAG TPA: TolC family protein, partial [Gemmatimonadaceae bacterium]
MELLRPDALVDAVLDDNPSLRAAQSAARAAEARIEPSGALDDPMLSMMAAPRTFGHSAMGTGVGIELSQRLPWPGKRDLKETIAELEARAVNQSIANTRLDLVLLAKDAFAEWYLVHASLEVNEANRELWREIRQIAEINYANGTGGKQEVLQADMEYQTLDHRQVVLERQRAEVLAQLNRLLNRQPGATLPPPAPLGEPSAVQPLIELRALALDHRAELDAAEAEL